MRNVFLRAPANRMSRLVIHQLVKMPAAVNEGRIYDYPVLVLLPYQEQAPYGKVAVKVHNGNALKPRLVVLCQVLPQSLLVLYVL